MFDMGFLPSILKILELLPEKRQNLMFSATMPSEIRRLADRVLENPHVVELSHSRPAETIQHALYPVRTAQKLEMLQLLLNAEDCRSAIVFTRTKHRAKRLADQLIKAGHSAIAIQGNLSQSQRDKALKGFRSGRYEVLVATDIVARGIDVSGVSYVINYDTPNTPEAYTHRIGRTGRAELEGRACTFVSTEDGEWIRATERFLGGPITRHELPGFEQVLIRGLAEQVSAPVRGRRGPRRAYGRRGRAQKRS
jgi:ATP-dependent RNA helicase RhlE